MSEIVKLNHSINPEHNRTNVRSIYDHNNNIWMALDRVVRYRQPRSGLVGISLFCRNGTSN
jgi:hypothetical protein